MRLKLLDQLIAESTEFACERWGQGEATVEFFAPVTRVDGVIWIHPTAAREYEWAVIRRKATRIWMVSGSLWNPRDFRLVHHRSAMANLQRLTGGDAGESRAAA